MILVCFGTRPEYIKVKSLIKNLNNIKTCFTGQHYDILKNIKTDYKLNFDRNLNNNKLNNIIINILNNNYIFDNIDYVLVQGDTTSAYAMAISAFNHKKIIHLEAGLRTNDIYDPYPEELNRQLISRLANIHLCPTALNKQNLINENITQNIFITGNTGLDNIDKKNCSYDNIILITLHRRNNIPIINKWFENIEIIAKKNKNLKFIFPMHPNPDIQKHKHILKSVDVINPINHSELINILKKCKFVISDSGGLQEESSFLNKKIIICRKTSERNEIIGTHGIFFELKYFSELESYKKIIDIIYYLYIF